MTATTLETDPKLRRARSFLLRIFFLSGFSSLIYQICWQKALSQIIGVDHHSVTLIVSLFMLGLGIGGILGARTAKKDIHLLPIYVLLEAALSIYGFFSLPLLRAVNQLVQPYAAGYAADFAVNFALLILPTMLMGMSLPIVVHLFSEQLPPGRAIGEVYSANIAGAAAGVLTTGFVLIGVLGLNNSCRIAALVNALISVLVLVFVRKSQLPAPRLNYFEEEEHAAANRTALISFLSGFAALSFEIIFFRIFTAYFGATSYVFSILIFSYLTLMAAGNYFFGKKADTESPQSLFALAACGAVISALLILWGQEAMALLGIRQNYLVLWPYRTWFAYAQLPVVLAVSMILMIPVAFVSGFFPVIVRYAANERGHLGVETGRIYFIQTLGNFSGTLVTGWLLLPRLGTVGTLILIAGILGAAVLISAWPDIRNFFTLRRSIAFAAASIAVLLYPHNFYGTVRLYYEANPKDIRKPAMVRESAFGVTLGYEKSNHQMEVYVGRMFSNSYPMKPSTLEGVDDCFPIETIASIKNLKVKKALYVGMGSGVGPFCIEKIFPNVQLDIAELNPDLPEMMRVNAADSIQRTLNQANLYLTDGRRFIQQHPDKKYDLVQIGVFGAWCSGCGNAFTSDFYSAVSRQLAPHGVLTFNAYPAAVKAALHVYPSLTILSPNKQRISDAVVSNEPGGLEFDTGKFINLVTRLDSVSGPGTVRIRWPIFKDGCFIDRESAESKVSGITMATDDLPVTEYYLTRNQFMYKVDWKKVKPEKDMRIFECGEGDKTFADFAKV